MSNEEMIENIKCICGDCSIAYYNIRNYANADNYIVASMYSQMLVREKAIVEDKIAELRRKLDLINVSQLS